MSANNLYIIGLTGGIGSGKSTAARILAELGAYHVDADAISRATTAPGGPALPAIREIFGDGVFDENGDLIRRKLGQITFSDPAKLRALEGIIHPLVQKIMLQQLDAARAQQKEIALLDVPLLFETGLDALCHETWVLTAPEETRIRRVMERDGLSEDEARRRMAQQMPDEEKVRRADRVIENDRSVEKLRSELTNLYEKKLRQL